jgi:CHRD domain
MRKRRVHVIAGIVTVGVAALAAASLAVASGNDHGGKGKKHENGGTVHANLTGYEETPSLNSPGSGKFKATLASDKITFELTYQNLTGNPLFAHVHIGQKGVAGGVSFFLCGGGTKPACPASTSGTVSGTVVAADVLGPTAQGFNPGDLGAVLAAIRAHVAYANIHTPKFPAGEIRGQLRGGGDDDDDD